MSCIACCVSSVSASGSTRRNDAPAAANVDTWSPVSRRYGVSSAPSGSRSWKAKSAMRANVSRPGYRLGMQDGYRVEHDTMGEVRVPASARYGASTQRAVENFPISGSRLEPRLVRALALIKGEAAQVNAKLKDVPKVTKKVADAISAAADEV